MYKKSEFDITISNIKKIIKNNEILEDINYEIEKLPLLSFSIFKSFDYIIDALNIEKGRINGFKNITKILTESKNNMVKKKNTYSCASSNE